MDPGPSGTDTAIKPIEHCEILDEADDAELQSRILNATLAQVAQSAPDSSATDSPQCCVICLDAVTEPCEAQPCRHRDFDYLCLLSWLNQQPRCPLCKTTVQRVLHDFDDPKFYTVPEPTAPPSQPPLRIPLSSGSHGREWTRAAGRRPRPNRESARRPPTQDDGLRRRRRVYRHQLYSLHVGANRTSRYRRELTPAVFEADKDLVSRARVFLRRELRVFDFLHGDEPDDTGSSAGPNTADSSSTSAATTAPRAPTRADREAQTLRRRRANNAEFLLEYIIAILKTVDTQGSQGQAEEMLKDFLGRDHARLLLHELRSFLRSPHSLPAWDREVQYPPQRKRSLAPDEVDGEDSHGRARPHRRVDQQPRRSDTEPPGGFLLDSYRPVYAHRRDGAPAPD